MAIVDMLRIGEKCACELLEDLHISQSTLSHHMKILCDSEIVTCESRGKWKYYRLSKQGLETAYRILGELVECAGAECTGFITDCAL